jgi:hypothetical protein
MKQDEGMDQHQQNNAAFMPQQFYGGYQFPQTLPGAATGV